MRDIPDAPWIGMCKEDWEERNRGRYDEEDEDEDEDCSD